MLAAMSAILLPIQLPAPRYNGQDKVGYEGDTSGLSLETRYNHRAWVLFLNSSSLLSLPDAITDRPSLLQARLDSFLLQT